MTVFDLPVEHHLLRSDSLTLAAHECAPRLAPLLVWRTLDARQIGADVVTAVEEAARRLVTASVRELHGGTLPPKPARLTDLPPASILHLRIEAFANAIAVTVWDPHTEDPADLPRDDSHGWVIHRRSDGTPTGRTLWCRVPVIRWPTTAAMTRTPYGYPARRLPDTWRAAG